MSNTVTCENCGVIMDLKVLHKKNATKRWLMAGESYCLFICQNCGEEGEV